MIRKDLIYVAGPYSATKDFTIEENIARAEAVSIALIRNGFHVLTPHKNTSGYQIYEGDKLCYETWIAQDLNLLSRCDAIYVMKDSKCSNGVENEIKFAKENGILVIDGSQFPPEKFTLEIYNLKIKK